MKMWSMWYQGRDSAPELCKRIFTLWERLNPEFELHVAEKDEVVERLKGTGVKIEGIGLEKVADLYRLDVLSKEGGLWIDATVLPTEPLNKWFVGRYDGAGFFARRDPIHKCIISSWMIYSEANHPLSVAWRNFFFEYYSTPRKPFKRTMRLRHCRSFSELLELRAAKNAPDNLWFVDPNRGFRNSFSPYFAMHYAFEYLVRTNFELEKEWLKVPIVPAGHTTLLSHAVQKMGWKAVAPWAAEYLNLSPVHKLAYKHSDFLPLLEVIEHQVAALEADNERVEPA